MTGQVDVAAGWQPIVGTPAQVRDAVAAARATGRLENMTRPRLVPDDSGRVFVRILMRQPEPPAVRRWPLVVAGGVVLAASATVAVVAVVAVVWVVAHWQLLLGAAVVSLVILFGLGRLGICPGVHCPGCRHS